MLIRPTQIDFSKFMFLFKIEGYLNTRPFDFIHFSNSKMILIKYDMIYKTKLSMLAISITIQRYGK